MWWWIACTTTTLTPNLPDETVDSPTEDTATAIDPPSPGAVAPNVVLNELQAANDASWMAPDGAFPDWVELFNASGETVDLSGFSLELDGERTALEGTLAPGAYLLLSARGDGAGDLPGGMDKDGGEIVLRWGNVVQDRVLWPAMAADAVLARIPDGRDWTSSARPTPEATNGSAPSPTDDPVALFYDRRTLSDIRLWISDASWDALTREPYEEVPASLAIGPAFYRTVGVHLKGRWGSFRDLNGKAGFTIDLDAYEPNQFRGLKKLTLNNMVQDPSYTHEVLTYTLYREMGVPASRTGWANLTVNGELFGLYLNVETVDPVMLSRWFTDASGPMWEGSYGADVDGNVDALEYDDGPPLEDKTPLYALRDALDLHPTATTEGIVAIEALVDLDEFLTMMAVEAVTFHWDGYTTRNNYHMYLDPSSGRFSYMPWGTDQTWVDAWYGPYDAQGRLFQWCMTGEACRARYDATLRATAQKAIDLDLESTLTQLDRWLDGVVGTDVRAERSSERDLYVEATRNTINSYPASLLATLPP